MNTFYSNGQQETHTETYNGLKSGLRSFKKGMWRDYEYHSNGNLAEETTYINEYKSGKYQKLDENGRILKAGKYLANEMHGVWQLYDEAH
ncbi:MULTISPECIES: hypothetical protein [Alteromonas]|uniref:hypothetical protein n=1 Tax=Alteromonas TaxID=226 RepID=UPI0013568AD0|nr:MULTISPECIES: hypothetical protein [Alteromonas]